MFKNQRQYRSKTGNGNSSFKRNGFSSRGSRRRPVKKLDSNLFIRQASMKNTETNTSLQTFSEFPLADKLQRNIQEHGYSHPTQIQEQTIPHLLNGRDVIGVAHTGTGKTAAFLIPLVHKVFLDKNERVLIVTPTRELAMQITEELRAFIKGMDLEVVLCIGGSNMERQEKKLHHNPHFVIGTPGRLRDLILERHVFDFGRLSVFRN